MTFSFETLLKTRICKEAFCVFRSSCSEKYPFCNFVNELYDRLLSAAMKVVEENE